MKINDTIHAIAWEWTMRHDPACYRSMMVRFWKTLLALMVVAMMGALGFAGWSMFIASEVRGASDVRVSTDSIETLSREQMKKTLDLFAKRKADFEKVQIEVSKITDPSL